MAGRRSVSTWDFDPRRGRPVAGPVCPEVVLLTNLFGAACSVGGCPSIGTPEPCEKAPEPCEKVMDDVSGPTLDLGLPCWDSGRRDSRRIQESLDDTESRAFSAIGLDARSPNLMKECLRPVALGDVAWTAVSGRGTPGVGGGCEVRGEGVASASWRNEA